MESQDTIEMPWDDHLPMLPSQGVISRRKRPKHKGGQNSTSLFAHGQEAQTPSAQKPDVLAIKTLSLTQNRFLLQAQG